MDAKRQRLVESSSAILEDGTSSEKYEVKFTCCSLFNNPLLSDIKLSINDGAQQYNVSKIILASRSSHFKEIFMSDTQSCPDKLELDVHEQFEPIFESFLKFLYGFPVAVCKENLWLYYFLAEKYSVDDLLKVCATFIRENLSITKRKKGDVVALDANTNFSVQEVVDIYEQFNNDYVKGYAASNLMARLDTMPDDLRLSLSKECVCAILNSESSVVSEKDLFLFGIAWLKHGGDMNYNVSSSQGSQVHLTMSQENRRSEAESILSNIRYCHMSKTADLIEAQMNPFVMSSPKLIALVASGCHYKFMKKELPQEEFVKLAEFKKKQYAFRRYKKADSNKFKDPLDTPTKSSPVPKCSSTDEN